MPTRPYVDARLRAMAGEIILVIAMPKLVDCPFPPARGSGAKADLAALVAAANSCGVPSYFTLVLKFGVVIAGGDAVRNCLYRMSPSKKTFIHDKPYKPIIPISLAGSLA